MKHYYLFSFIVLSFINILAQAQDPIKIHPDDPHRFQYKGELLHIAGYYPDLGTFTNFQTGGWTYTAPEVDVWNFYKEYFAELKKHNLNYIRIVSSFHRIHQGWNDPNVYHNNIHPYKRTGTGTAPDGKKKFNLDEWNEDFFTMWNDFVDLANQNDIIVQFCFFDGAHLTGCEGGGTCWDYFNASHNSTGINADAYTWYQEKPDILGYQQRFVRKLIDKLGGYPNIIWEVINEPRTKHGDVHKWEGNIANYITQYEKQKGIKEHLVMPRDLPEHRDLDHWIKNSPTYHHNYIANRYSWNKPMISDNDCCVDPGAPEYRRKRAWAAVTGGGYMNYFHDEARVKSVLYHSATQSAMKWVGYTRKFLVDQNINTVKMTPADNLVSSGWCLAKTGVEYLIYLENGGKTTVQGLPSVYNATWFNPRNGAIQPAGNGPTFTSPDGNDWVLHIKQDLSVDAAAVEIQEIPDSSCNRKFVPKLKVRNNGPETLFMLTIGIKYDNKPITKKKIWAPQGGLAPGSTHVFQLAPSDSLAPGNHDIRVFTETPNDVADKDLSNDTLILAFHITEYCPGEVTLLSVTEPLVTGCLTDIVPKVVLRNTGSVALNELSIEYQIDQQSVISKTYSTKGSGTSPGIIISLRGDSTSLQPGVHTMKIWTANPNGQADLKPANDSLIYEFTITEKGLPLPFFEGFESSTKGKLPAGWSGVNMDDSYTWFITDIRAKTDSFSLAINNFQYTDASDEKDEVILPGIDLTGSINPVLTFELAHASKPGSSDFDSLEVLVSTDCGNTFQQVFGKGGPDLNTAPEDSTIFLPDQTTGWRLEKIDLSNYAGNDNVIIKFVNWSNGNNSTLIDDILISSSTTGIFTDAPKTVGYYPNPANEIVHISFSKAGKKNIVITDLSGKIVINESTEIRDEVYKLSLKDIPSGVYIILFENQGELTRSKLVISR